MKVIILGFGKKTKIISFLKKKYRSYRVGSKKN